MGSSHQPAVATPTNTYRDMPQWGKGVVQVNGHNLGHY
jgi:hypothetical protein